MGRSILAVLLGLILTNLTIFGIEFVGHAVYTPEAGLDSHDPAALHDAMAEMPTGVFMFILSGWVVGTAAGAWLAAYVSGRARILHGLAVGGMVMAAAIALMVHIPHPAWLWVVSLTSIPTAAYAGAWCANRGKATEPGSSNSPEGT
jgi:hypothetical protein